MVGDATSGGLPSEGSKELPGPLTLPSNPWNTKLQQGRNFKGVAFGTSQKAGKDCSGSRQEYRAAMPVLPKLLLDKVFTSGRGLEADSQWNAGAIFGNENKPEPSNGGGPGVLDERWLLQHLPCRKPMDREDVLMVKKWLEGQTMRFDSENMAIGEVLPNTEALKAIAAKAGLIYKQAMHELARQVAVHCKERGQLILQLWRGYTALQEALVAAVLRVNAEHAASEQALQLQIQQLLDSTDDMANGEEGLLAHQALEDTTHQAPDAVDTHPTALVTGPQQGPATRASNASSGGIGRMSAFYTSPNHLSVGHPRVSEASMHHFGRKPRASTAESISHEPHKTSSVLHPTHLSQQAESDLALKERIDLMNAYEDLRGAFQTASQELYAAREKIYRLEQEADEVTTIQSRLDVAENERDLAVEAAALLTPRPSIQLPTLQRLVGSEGVKRILEAALTYRSWPTQTLAKMLMGPTDTRLTAGVSSVFGCLAAAIASSKLTREAVCQALKSQTLRVFTEECTPEQLQWVQEKLMLTTVDTSMLTELLTASDDSGQTFSAEYYGCLQPLPQDLTAQLIEEGIHKVCSSTSMRADTLESQYAVLQSELEELREIVRVHREAEEKKHAARRRREEEASVEKKNPVELYIELLESHDESAWKENLIGMGTGADIPKLFKHNGKLRNRHLTKRETEHTVKEIWAAKIEEHHAGKATEMLEFCFQFFQKKVGILHAVVEMGHNLLYGLFMWRADADCELFLKVLKEEVHEDVYLQQVSLQDELTELFVCLDRAQGQGPSQTGFVSKADLRTALESYFRVHQKCGKTLDRFDDLLKALEEDQPGDKVEHKKVFEEDREYNQGAFAEAIRDQFLQERIEHLKAVEQALYDETANEEECTQMQVAAALQLCDDELTDKQAALLAATFFVPGNDSGFVKVVMRRLRRGAVRRGRTDSSHRLSLAPKTQQGKKKGKPHPLIEAALQAVRQRWLETDFHAAPKLTKA